MQAHDPDAAGRDHDSALDEILGARLPRGGEHAQRDRDRPADPVAALALSDPSDLGEPDDPGSHRDPDGHRDPGSPGGSDWPWAAPGPGQHPDPDAGPDERSDPEPGARPGPADPGDDTDWHEQISRLLRRPENLRSRYQPVVDLRTGGCAGYQASTRLAEWPARSPEPWFSAASRLGLAARLEAAALRTCLRARSDLPPEQFLTVNLAAATLGHLAVTEVLLEQGSLQGLVIDLVEPGPEAVEGIAAAALAGLRERGLLLAMDVGGGGVAELERVRELRPDVLQLTGRLVRGCHADGVLARLVTLLVDLADELGASLLAQGVEALEDARYLQSVGVGMAQGWLFGRPQPGLVPPSSDACTWIRAAWEENVTLTRLGRLALPLPRAGDGVRAGAPWLADLDESGRLLALVSPTGERVPASGLIRLRSSAPLHDAARRVLDAGSKERPHPLVSIVDDDGRFVGVSDGDAILREALASGKPQVIRRSVG